MLSGTIIYIVLSCFTIIILFTMTCVFFNRRSFIGALPMSFIMLFGGIWALFNFLSAMSKGQEMKVFWDNLSFIGATMVPAIWLIFSIKYTRKEPFSYKKYKFALYIIPIITLHFIFIKSLRPLFITDINLELLEGSSIYLINYKFGIWFWVHVIYSYLCIFLGTILFIKMLIELHQVYKKQVMTMLIGVIIPLIGSSLYILGYGPVKVLDTTVFSFGVSGVIFYIGMYKYKILEVAPIAREAVIEIMEDMVVVMDVNNVIIDINKAVRETFGKRSENFIGQSVESIIKNSKLNQEININSDGVEKKVTIRFYGKLMHFDIRKSNLYDSKKNIIGSILVLRDITDLEETLNNLEKSKLIAESASKAKSEFLAVMSHEIRTPIHGVIGMAELLEDAKLSDIERENLEALKNSADSLLHIINDILDFSKIEAGNMQLENITFDIREVILNAVRTVNFSKNGSKVELKYEIDKSIPKYISGDSMRLKQILLNLLSNAFKFTEKGKVELKAYPVVIDDTKVLLEFVVSDTGIGISEDKIERLFEKFHQLDSSTTREYGGTGLGLSIVKKLIDLMGGDIRVESEAGKGSNFIFQIPFFISDELVAVDKISCTEEGSLEENYLKENCLKENIKILLADDSRVNQKMMCQIIRKKNWEVDVAEDGVQVLEMLNSSYDLILMDIQMPKLDGFETTKKIRENEVNVGSHIPIIALTANATDEDRKNCLQVGMDDYISKPVKAEVFYSRILANLKN
jgi:PAS domain S-box-containing protein